MTEVTYNQFRGLHKGTPQKKVSKLWKKYKDGKYKLPAPEEPTVEEVVEEPAIEEVVEEVIEEPVKEVPKKSKKAKIDKENARKEHRVTCGANIVMKNVLPFLALK